MHLIIPRDTDEHASLVYLLEDEPEEEPEA